VVKAIKQAKFELAQLCTHLPIAFKEDDTVQL